MHSNQGGVVRFVDELHIKITQTLAHGRKIVINIGGIGHNQEFFVAQAVGDKVVNHAALVVGENRVLGATGLEYGHVGDQSVVEECSGIGPGDAELTHVGEVENTGAGAHSLMLGNIVGVFERHIPAAEVGECGS